VGQDEQAFALVACANFRRREYAALNPVAHSCEVSGDLGKPEVDVVADVLEEAELGSHLPDDAGDVGPEVAGVVGPASLAGHAERLARVAANDAIHDATPRSAVEGAGI
jgi:hypothetical protein